MKLEIKSDFKVFLNDNQEILKKFQGDTQLIRNWLKKFKIDSKMNQNWFKPDLNDAKMIPMWFKCDTKLIPKCLKVILH